MANHKKYDEEVLLKYKNGEITIEELCKMYEVSRTTMWKALSRREIYSRKEKIKIIAPFKTVIVNSKQECAEELKISYSSVVRELKGIRCKMLEDMGIRLEIIE